MRPRTFILLIVVLVVAVIAFLLIFFLRPEMFGRGEAEATAVVEQAQQEPGLSTPTPTPEVVYETVVVARTDLPVGERIMAQLITLERRPETNVAVTAGVTFDDPALVVGRIVKTHISRGQEILRPMLALNPSDIDTLGSDLALYISEGQVAVAFPINKFSGAAYGMRPGDLLDAFMSLELVDLDEEFQTKLPNIVERVNEQSLIEGQAFLFPATTEGRLELIPILNTVASIAPGQGKEPIPRSVTQLTLQQMEVLWVGSWRNPNSGMQQEFRADALQGNVVIPEGQPQPQPTKQRPEDNPDLIILGMSPQDALALKWALDTGINIDLVLRAQGDRSVFVTTSVSLPLFFEQGYLTEPAPGPVGLEPRIDALPTPGVPVSPPQ